MKSVKTDVSFPKLEENILEFWKENNIFQRSMDPLAPNAAVQSSGDSSRPKFAGSTSKQDQKNKKTPRPSYVFYDGPPFATGLPHYGHLLAGTIKDVVGRFFTMKGFYVDRRFGWDCHGVPVEFEIQKSLDLHGSKAIRQFGVDKFNEECRKIVLRYTQEWRRFVERSGRWVDFEREYRTMDLDYMESIWWVIKTLWDQKLIYEGLKCVPYSWAINTPLSNFEANLNYKNVQDPAVTVRFKILSDLGFLKSGLRPANCPVYAYIWTTTPWTLPSNLALAVNPELSYVLVHNPADNEIAIVAESLAASLFDGLLVEEADLEKAGKARNLTAENAKYPRIIAQIPGSKLLGLEYQPPFHYFEQERSRNAFRIYSGEFVTAEEGTGIVHCASFGEEDLTVFQAHGITIVDPVDEDGNFLPVVSDFAGLNIKEADTKIVAHLKAQGVMVSHKTIEHSYPFCWRTDTPLIYRSISSWFVRVEAIQEDLLKANRQIHWVPDHLRDGRFGKWLEGARDWAISRNRFWGTPIPIWRCESCNETICLGSVSELEKRSGALVKDLHSHFIDSLKFPCHCGKGSMSRIPQVLDCWFESGAMPYAQAHYPFENKEAFEQTFPADFIAEGLDQTRGWFYTLLVLSTALFKKPAFKNVIVNGIVLAEDGKKMSKSLKNYPPPDEVMNEFGADAMRLYLLASAATRAEELRFSKQGVRDVVRQTLLPLWNAYNFFVTYALVDKWSSAQIPNEQSPNLLDRWMLSKVASLVQRVDEALSAYHLYAVAPPLLDFVDQLTNWYIRLNRRRFWSGASEEEQIDKAHAYSTLHRSLLLFVRVLAPLAPFISEEIFRNLTEGLEDLEYDSVHLAPYPGANELEGFVIDELLEHSMELFEGIILLGRQIRNDQGHKLRQPLAKLTVVHHSEHSLKNLREFDDYIRDELNVKAVEYSSDEQQFVELKAKLNTKRLGKVLGPQLGSDGMRKLQTYIQALSTKEINVIESGSSLNYEGLTLGPEDIIIERAAKPGVEACASSGQITIVYDTVLSQELRLEGLMREVVNRVQKMRKDFGFEVTDRIVIRYMTANSWLQVALNEHREYVMKETLAVELKEVSDEVSMQLRGSSVHLPVAQDIDGKILIISLTRIQG